MSSFDLKIDREPKLENPVLVEGLPGIGHVGRLAAKHIIDELKAKKFATLYSHSFPPQVLIKEDGMIGTMKNEFYYWKAEESSQRDILFVTGNTQSTTSDGQYELSEKILDVASNHDVDMIYTLGGLGVGRIVEKPRVFGAITNKKFISELEKLNVVVKREGIGQIIGVSGLLLGLGKIRGIDGICLMGETSGYYLDPNSAKAVLRVLTKLLNVTINMDKLTKEARDTEKRVAEAQEIERKMIREMGMAQRELSEDEMRYIG
jgi:hypothetical protein